MLHHDGQPEGRSEATLSTILHVHATLNTHEVDWMPFCISWEPREPPSEMRRVELLWKMKKPNEETKDVTSCGPTTVRGPRRKETHPLKEPAKLIECQALVHFIDSLRCFSQLTQK